MLISLLESLVKENRTRWTYRTAEYMKQI